MKTSNVTIAGIFVIALIIGVGIGYISHGNNSSAPIVTATSSQLSTTTIIVNTTEASQQPNANTGNNIVVDVLYTNKTVQLSAPTYNPTFNYVTGCYWTDGYYNFSFDAPYSGYIVFNETNNGIPTNFTTIYWDLVVSTEKPRYVTPSPYNGSYWCPGETVQSNVAPYTIIAPFNNQTMIIPVVSGINYMYFDNGNANQQHGVNPFPINITFSMKYYGFKNVSYPAQPPFNFNKTISIPWGKYP